MKWLDYVDPKILSTKFNALRESDKKALIMARIIHEKQKKFSTPQNTISKPPYPPIKPSAECCRVRFSDQCSF